MSAQFGKNWKINRITKDTPDTYYQLGGSILDARIDSRVTVHEEAGSQTRQLVSQEVVAAKPVVEWTQNIRRLTDYITTYAMITAEGTVPAHILYVTDGAEHHDCGGCKVNSCRINIRQLESIKASLSVPFKTHATPSLGTFLYRTEVALYKDAVTALTLNAVAVTKWSEIEFGIDNNVVQEILGTAVLPSEVEEQEARYFMRLTRARVGATSKFGDALAGTEQDFVIALTDKQSSPVTKTFTFADMYLRTARKEDRALGIIMERLEGVGKSLVIS